MDKTIKALKIVLLSLGIVIGSLFLVILFHVYMGIRSGDLKTYAAKVALEALVDEESLSPNQQVLLESGDLEGLAQDLEQNITQEQIDCAVSVVGAERAQELVVTQDPTPQEVLKLAKCL